MPERNKIIMSALVIRDPIVRKQTESACYSYQDIAHVHGGTGFVKAVKIKLLTMLKQSVFVSAHLEKTKKIKLFPNSLKTRNNEQLLQIHKEPLNCLQLPPIICVQSFASK